MHWTLENPSRCFYVGKGVKGRPQSQGDRNHKWHAIVKRLGLHVEVCVGPMSNAQACAWEISNIEFMGTFSMNHSHDDDSDIGCNFTIGGDGIVGRVQTLEEKNKRQVSLKHAYKNIELRNKLRLQQLVHWSDDASHRAHASAIKMQANTSQTRLRKRIAMMISWCDDRTNRTLGNRRRWSDPEQRLKQSEILKQSCSTLEVRKRKSDAMKLVWNERRRRRFHEKAMAWFVKSHTTV